jgi:hypothetical protein
MAPIAAHSSRRESKQISLSGLFRVLKISIDEEVKLPSIFLSKDISLIFSPCLPIIS